MTTWSADVRTVSSVCLIDGEMFQGASRGVGAVCAELPRAVVYPFAVLPVAGMPVDINAELVAFDEPGKVLEYEEAPFCQLGGAFLEERLIVFIKDRDFEPIGGQFDFNWAIFRCFDIEQLGEIARDRAKKAFVGFDIFVLDGGFLS